MWELLVPVASPPPLWWRPPEWSWPPPPSPLLLPPPQPCSSICWRRRRRWRRRPSQSRSGKTKWKDNFNAYFSSEQTFSPRPFDALTFSSRKHLVTFARRGIQNFFRLLASAHAKSRLLHPVRPARPDAGDDRVESPAEGLGQERVQDGVHARVAVRKDLGRHLWLRN